jgi:hypothetical protein
VILTLVPLGSPGMWLVISCEFLTVGRGRYGMVGSKYRHTYHTQKPQCRREQEEKTKKYWTKKSEKKK